MEVVRATESVMYRIALCGSFGNKFLHKNNLIGCQEAAVHPPNNPAMQFDTSPTQSPVQSQQKLKKH